MLTVKFYKHLPDGQELMTTISCVNYQHYVRADKSVSITTFQKMTDTDGVERHVSHEDKIGHFTSCYVENAAGKTINSYHCSI